MNPTTVTRLRATTSIDGRGSQVRDWLNASTEIIENVLVAPAAAGESHDNGREAVNRGWELFGLTSIDLLATDRVLIDGATFEVDGEPERWNSPWGGVHGLKAKLKRVEG